MTTPLIAVARVARIVAAAQTSPTADNCQPWTFHWDGASLAVRRDDGRARHTLDAGGRASIMTLGCVLEATALAAGREGLAAAWELSPRLPTWATVRFTPGAGAPSELARALERRCTDRRFYRGGALTDPVFASVREDARRFGGAAVHVQDRLSPELAGFIADADGYLWRHEDVYRDLVRWMRFSRREVEATRDGIAWNTVWPDLPAVPGMSLARSPLMAKLVDGARLYRISRLLMARSVASSAALLCVTVQSTAEEDLVAAGRLGLSTWLRLNEAGYGVQPLTAATLPVYYAALDVLPRSTRPEFVDLFRRGRAVLARGFGLPGGELPVWLLRAGLSPPLSAEHRALRLPLDRVFTSSAPA